MGEDGFAKLTDRQKSYLRLVLRHANSGEIARAEAERGASVSKAAIDKVIRQAMERIGATSRFQAARMLADYEDAQGVRRSDLSTSDLSAPPSAMPSDLLLQEQREGLPDLAPIALEDVGVRYAPAPPAAGAGLDRRPGASVGTIWGRVWRSLLITIALALVTIALGNVLAELSH